MYRYQFGDWSVEFTCSGLFASIKYGDIEVAFLQGDEAIELDEQLDNAPSLKAQKLILDEYLVLIQE